MSIHPTLTMANASQPDEKSHTTGFKSVPAVEINQVRIDDQSTDEYFQAVENKRRAWPRSKGEEVIRALLRQNVFRTRAVLYKDYINYRQMDALDDQTQIQLHIDQYSVPAIRN
jgi:hypothetical protein